MQREDFEYPFRDLPRLTHFGYSDAQISLEYGPHYHYGYELTERESLDRVTAPAPARSSST